MIGLDPMDWIVVGNPNTTTRIIVLLLVYLLGVVSSATGREDHDLQRGTHARFSCL